VLGVGRAAEPAHTPAAPPVARDAAGRCVRTPARRRRACAGRPARRGATGGPARRHRRWPLLHRSRRRRSPPLPSRLPGRGAPVASVHQPRAVAPPVTPRHPPPPPPPRPPRSPDRPVSACAWTRGTHPGERACSCSGAIPTSGPHGARPIRIADATRSLSKTHALVRPAPVPNWSTASRPTVAP
jgi:hypothetical protein